MGHYADKFAGKTSEEPQKFFLNTGEAKNFARELTTFPGQESVIFVMQEGLSLTWKISEHIWITLEEGVPALSPPCMTPLTHREHSSFFYLISILWNYWKSAVSFVGLRQFCKFVKLWKELAWIFTLYSSLLPSF